MERLDLAVLDTKPLQFPLKVQAALGSVYVCVCVHVHVCACLCVYIIYKPSLLSKQFRDLKE